MDQFEEAVLNYLCGPPERFVNPQFSIPYADFKGGSCPDFVALDFRDQTVYVVEVTSAGDSKAIRGKIVERNTRWFSPLREHLNRLGPIFHDWDYHVSLFVRDEEWENAKKKLQDLPDVSVISLKKVVFSWDWDWQGSRPDNPLREAGKLHRVHPSAVTS